MRTKTLTALDFSAACRRGMLLGLATTLICVAAVPGIVHADQASPPAAAPDTDYAAAFGKSIDTAHERLEQNILEQTVRFDNFFGDVGSDELRHTGYELRWRNSLRLKEGGKLDFGSSVRAHFILSAISNRLRLVIAGENEPAPITQSLPRDAGNPGFDRTTPSAHFANTELRYDLVRKPHINMFLGAGVQLRLPFEAFVRSRLQYTHHFSDIFLLRLAETGFVKNTDLFGETTEISIDRLVGEKSIIRWSNAGTASQEIGGLEWGSELSLIRELQAGQAFTILGGAYGNTKSPAFADNYRVLARYRSNFMRPWLFYEVEPEISWPRRQDGGYPATLSIAFRMEVVFQGNYTAAQHAARSAVVPPLNRHVPRNDTID